MAKRETYLMDLQPNACDVAVRRLPNANYLFVVRTHYFVLDAHVTEALDEGDIGPEEVEAFRDTWHFGLIALCEGGIQEGCFEPCEAWRLETIVKSSFAYRRNPNRVARVAALAGLDRIAHTVVGKMTSVTGDLGDMPYGTVRLYAEPAARFRRPVAS